MKESLVRNLNIALDERDTKLFLELLEIYYVQSGVYEAETASLTEKFRHKIVDKDAHPSWEDVKFLLSLIGLKLVRGNGSNIEQTSFMD
jgi:hypothetical protein